MINICLVKAPLGASGGTAYARAQARHKNGVFQIKKNTGSEDVAAIRRFLASYGITRYSLRPTDDQKTFLILIRRGVPKKSGVVIHLVSLSAMLQDFHQSGYRHIRLYQAVALEEAIRLARLEVGKNKKTLADVA